MNPYLNIKPSGSPTLLSYNGTRQGVDFWNDPQTPTLLVILVFILLIIVVLCYGIKEKYFPNVFEFFLKSTATSKIEPFPQRTILS